MATRQSLLDQRAQLEQEIMRKGGAGFAPIRAQKVEEINAQLKAMRAARGGGQRQGQGPQILPKNTKINSVPQGINAEGQVQDYAAERNIGINNPTINGPFGSQVVTTDANGNPIVTQTLDPSQQEVVNADTSNSIYGRGLVQSLGNQYNIGQGFNPNLTQRNSTGDIQADRQRIEESLFKSLTRNNEADRNREMEAKKQELANRGIPLGSQLFNQEISDINRRYDELSANARDRAVAQGGEEYSRDVGINETMRANDFGLQSGTRDQQLGELNQFAGFGQGAMIPNFPQYQGYNYQLNSPVQVQGVLGGLRNDRKKLELEQQALRRAGSGGRGGGGPQESPLFVSQFPEGS